MISYFRQGGLRSRIVRNEYNENFLNENGIELKEFQLFLLVKKLARLILS